MTRINKTALHTSKSLFRDKPHARIGMDGCELLLFSVSLLCLVLDVTRKKKKFNCRYVATNPTEHSRTLEILDKSATAAQHL